MSYDNDIDNYDVYNIIYTNTNLDA